MLRAEGKGQVWERARKQWKGIKPGTKLKGWQGGLLHAQILDSGEHCSTAEHFICLRELPMQDFEEPAAEQLQKQLSDRYSTDQMNKQMKM